MCRICVNCPGVVEGQLGRRNVAGMVIGELEGSGKPGSGSWVTKRLSSDLRRTFPDMKGLSETNLRHMRAFAQAWPDWEVCSQAVSKLPWGHNLELVPSRLSGGSFHSG